MDRRRQKPRRVIRRPRSSKSAAASQVVVFYGSAAEGLDPKTGDSLWKYPYPTNYDCNIATPIAVDGNVFLSAGENHGSVLLSLKPKNADSRPGRFPSRKFGNRKARKACCGTNGRLRSC